MVARKLGFGMEHELLVRLVARRNPHVEVVGQAMDNHRTRKILKMTCRLHKSQTAMSLYGFSSWSWSHSLEMSFRDEDSFRHTLGGFASLSNGHFRSFCSADRTRMPGSFRSSSMASSFRSEP